MAPSLAAFALKRVTLDADPDTFESVAVDDF
jgi:hypothetical protein